MTLRPYIYIYMKISCTCLYIGWGLAGKFDIRNIMQLVSQTRDTIQTITELVEQTLETTSDFGIAPPVDNKPLMTASIDRQYGSRVKQIPFYS